jgi:hypothetical protein
MAVAEGVTLDVVYPPREDGTVVAEGSTTLEASEMTVEDPIGGRETV